MSEKYRNKPVVIEAMQFTNTNLSDIAKWLCDCDRSFQSNGETITLSTLEGVMMASLNDWIIKGVKGEFYPCKPDIFEMTYEPVSTQPGA